MKQKLINLEDELFETLEKLCADGEMSEFIRQAIKEKINRKIISNEQLSNRMKKLDNLDTEVVHKTAVDIEFTTQVIFEEIKKQNEILKLIHRRSLLSAGFSQACYKKVHTGDELKAASDTIMKAVKNEQQQLNF